MFYLRWLFVHAVLSEVVRVHAFRVSMNNGDLDLDLNVDSDPPPGFCGPHHRNLEGHDLTEGGRQVSESRASLEQCTQLCRERPACTAFNWIPHATWSHQSECYLKTGITDSSQWNGYNADWVNIYLKCGDPAPTPPPAPPPPPSDGAFCGPHHRNLRGHDLMEGGQKAKESRGTLERCTQLCRERPACTAFSWIPYAFWSHQSECYLKTGITDPSQVTGDHGDWVNIYLKCGGAAPTPPPSHDNFYGGAAPTPPPSHDSFDVIIVGSGLTGSAFAGKLVEGLGSSKRILMLEAGGASHSQLSPHGHLYGANGGDPPADCQSWFGHCSKWPGWQSSGGTRWDVPGNYQVLPCWNTRCSHAWHNFPSYQCKILGGCGVSNGALMQQPSHNNFNSWPAGWKWSDLEPYFQDVQHRFSITGTPSADGRHYLDDTGADVLEHALHGVDFTTDDAPRNPRANTMGIPKVAAYNGVRQSTANVMLADAVESSNFQLMLNAEVKEILFEHGRATGVRYSHEGSSRTVALSSNGRVVLAGGAFNSPRLLLNSGVGPGLRINNQGVGRGISDHTISSVKYKFPRNSGIKSFRYDPPSQDSIEQYVHHKSGPLAQYGPTLAAFFASNPHGEEEFDVEAFVNPAKSENEMDVWFVLMKPDCSSADVQLKDRGDAVRTSGAAHFGCNGDKAKVEHAIDKVTTALGKVGAWRDRPHESLRGDPMNHWAGSCKLGSCVDANTLLVHGTDNVAVVDASILPGQIWGHPALSLKATALKAADIVAEQLRR